MKNFITKMSALMLAVFMCMPVLGAVNVFAAETVNARIPVSCSGADCTAVLYDENGTEVQRLELKRGQISYFEFTCRGLREFKYSIKLDNTDTSTVTYDKTEFKVTVYTYYNTTGDEVLHTIVADPTGTIGEEGSGKPTNLEFKNRTGSSGGGGGGGGSSTKPKIYTEHYSYEGDYPQEVLDTLPGRHDMYANGERVDSADPMATEVVVEGGKWVFKGWDKVQKTVDGQDVYFVGIWEYVPDEPVEPVIPPVDPVEPDVPVKPEEPTPVPPVTPSVPKTGDDTHLNLWRNVVIASACGLAFAGISIVRARRKENDD